MAIDSSMFDRFREDSKNPLKKRKKETLPGEILPSKNARVLLTVNKYSHTIHIPHIDVFRDNFACCLELLYGVREKKAGKFASCGIKSLRDAERIPQYASQAKAALKALDSGFDSVKKLMVKRFPRSRRLFFLLLSYFKKEELIFVDIESVGLSFDTPIIMIGAGYFEGEEFVVKQFTSLDYASEYEMLVKFAELLKGKKSFVTYNGGGFDIPYIENRLGFYGIENDIESMHNFDLLHFSRRAYMYVSESFRLKAVERLMKIKDRPDDIDGSEVAMYYDNFVRSKDPSWINPIIYHNKEDIESLLLIMNKLSEKWIHNTSTTAPIKGAATKTPPL